LNEDDRIESKADMRKRLKLLLGSLPAARFVRAGRGVLRQLESGPYWEEARTVCSFLSMAGEIDTEPLCLAAVAAGKTLCLPRVEGDDLSFRSTAMSGPWSVGAFGIREPPPDSVPADFTVLAGPVLVVVPGLAFDASGGRLGRGRGYYDRFIRALRAVRPDAHAVGIALAEQLVPAVPVERFDERIDMLIVDALP